MSGGRFSIIPAHALDDKRLSGAALKVLCMIGTYGDKTGWCFPSHGEIAKRLDISRQAVQKQAAILQKLGYIETRPRHRGDGSRSSNEYRLVFDRELPLDFDRDTLQPVVATPQPPVAHMQPNAVAPLQPLEVAPPATSGGCSINDPIERSKPERTARRVGRHPLPVDFSVSDSISAWAEKAGFKPYVQAHFDYFVDWARGGGHMRSDWEATFRNCVRADWGDVRKTIIKGGGIKPPEDTSCRYLVAGAPCGLPGEPHQVYRFMCRHHRRKEEEALTRTEIPPQVRKALADIKPRAKVTP